MDFPHEDAIRWLVAQTARLRSAHGEVIGDPELLQPTGDYFPDEFSRDAESVARLFARLKSYAPLSERVDVRLRFVEGDDAKGGGCGSGGCGSGACATEEAGPKDRVVPMGDGYIVELPVNDVGHPIVLTTALARAVGSLVLFEAEEDVDDGELGAMSEVAAHVCGAGVLLTSGAYIYGKGCSGVHVTRHTHLPVEQHTLLLAIFCQLHGVKPGAAAQHLETTQRDAFDEAWVWASSNARLMHDLKTRPEVLADGIFTIEPARSLFGRVSSRIFGKRDPIEAPSAPPSQRPKRARSAEEERRLAEARALVEETWGESRG